MPLLCRLTIVGGESAAEEMFVLSNHKTTHTRTNKISLTGKVETSIPKLIFILILAWTFFIGVLLWFNISQAYKTAEDAALLQARTAFEKDVMYRRWVSGLGGVFGKTSDSLPPNPYLSEEGREIEGSDGTVYTKVNPAYMTRLVNELGELESGVIGRITSNNPIRSENMADDWESQALLQMEGDGNVSEISAIQDLDGKEYLRFMGALQVEESCLSCHAFQGYKVGDQRGGISVAVPMEPFTGVANNTALFLALTHISVWLFGTLLLLYFGYLMQRLRERGEAKLKLQLLADELEERVEERTRDLDLARQAAENANNAKSVFLSNMSHEIRSPMNAIIGMTNIGLKAPDPQRKDYAFDKIGTASSHLLGIINDVLDMSKIESGKMTLAPAECRFTKTLQRALEVNSFLVNEKEQTLTVRVDDDIPELLFFDDQRLTQVITNLLSNAVKFTPKGGSIHLDARVAERQQGSCTLQIEVRDSGIGISAEQQQSLFQAFEQADNSTSRKFGGTGLGLVISKRLVEMMGGRMWLQSEEGKGAVFTFTVKAGEVEGKAEVETAAGARAEAGAKAASGTPRAANDGKAPAAEPVFPKRRVLLAEDIDVNREIVCAVLEPTKLEIVCANDGREAVRLYKEDPEGFDLILMDLQMPEMGGLEATGLIRSYAREHNCKPVPIVAMTANVFREDVENCLEAGMDGHIGKPLDSEELYAVLEKYLS
jgi:signal transduction histidine kinase